MNTINPPKISVIVPVYNTAQYLPRCLESLINQTLSDIEIIIINDGSTDNSHEIIETFVKTHPDKIRAFHKPNSGVSSARNSGINNAQGEYIGFVDSDDYVENIFFELMYKIAIKNDRDIVCCNYLEKKYSDVVKILTVDKIMNNKYQSEPVVWNKLIKRSLLTKYKLQFTPNIIHEDFEFHYKICSITNNIGICESYLYHYNKSNQQSYTYNNKLDLNSMEIVCQNLLKWQRLYDLKDNLFILNLQRLLFFYLANQRSNIKAKEIWQMFQPLFRYKIKRSYNILNSLFNINFHLGNIISSLVYKLKKLKHDA